MQRTLTGCGSTLSKLTLVIALGVLTTLARPASAVDVYTDPVGFITISVVGTNGLGAGNLSFLGLGMTQIPTNVGRLTAASGTKLTVNNTLTAGAFDQITIAALPNPLYFIEITSGTLTGLVDDVASNDATSVFTTHDLTAFGVTGNETYKIYPLWTLNSLFGAADQAGLQGGTAAPPADEVLVPNQLSQTFTTYFWFTGKGGPKWENPSTGSADQGQASIPIDQGILIRRNSLGTNTSSLVVGGVKLGPTLIPIGPANNFVGNVYASSAMTLSNSGLVAAGLVGGTATPPADAVLIHNDAAGVYSTYFYFTGKGGPKWENPATGSTDQGATQIPLGGNILIQLATGHTGFTWPAQAPYTP